MVDIQELQAAGCAHITNSLTVLFTASHPNLGAVSVNMIGPGGPYAFTLPTPLPETGDWYGTATPAGWTLANLTPWAYKSQSRDAMCRRKPPFDSTGGRPASRRGPFTKR